MATPVLMPLMGMTMEEGIISAWLVADGDTVKEGDPIVEFETDKINAASKRPPTESSAASAPGRATPSRSRKSSAICSSPVRSHPPTTRCLPPPPRPRPLRQLQWKQLQPPPPPSRPPPPPQWSRQGQSARAQDCRGTGPRPGRLAGFRAGWPDRGRGPSYRRSACRPRDRRRRDRSGRPAGRLKSSPFARKLAVEVAIDIATLTGSGPGGRIVAADVRRPQPRRPLCPRR